MDDRKRNPDRADTLRKLSQAAAGWAHEILLKDMQHGLQQAPVGKEACDRGTGDPHGGLAGLTCHWCGKDLPEGCMIRREFCDGKCRQSFYTEQKRQARAEARKRQKCLWCGGPMRDDYPGRIYCSQACSNHAQDDIQRKKNKRACKHCGKSFFAAPVQIFCSHACYCADKRKRFPKVCPVCGVTFMPHRPEQKTCSRACDGLTRRCRQ